MKRPEPRKIPENLDSRRRTIGMALFWVGHATFPTPPSTPPTTNMGTNIRAGWVVEGYGHLVPGSSAGAVWGAYGGFIVLVEKKDPYEMGNVGVWYK